MKLGEMVKISKGKKYNEVPFELAKHRYLNIEDLHGGKEERYTDGSGTEVIENDILIAWDGANAGKVGVGFKGLIGSTLARLRPIIEGIDSKYVFWFLESCSDLIKSQRTGATIPHVNGQTLREIEIPLPPLSTQQRIAEILDKADALRRKDQALLKKYDELAQAIFIDMFGDPVKNEMGWEVRKLGSLIDGELQNGLYKPSTSYGTGVPILRIDSFYDGVVSNIEKLKRLELSSNEIELYKLQENDIVINRVNSREYLGKCGLIPKLTEPMVFESNMMKFKANTGFINPIFLVKILSHPFMKRQILNRCKDSVNQSSINQQDVKSFDVLLPNIERQDDYAEVVYQYDRIVLNIKNQIIHSENLFQSLLQQAFKGELV